jgi:hypothetical protein
MHPESGTMNSEMFRGSGLSRDEIEPGISSERKAMSVLGPTHNFSTADTGMYSRTDIFINASEETICGFHSGSVRLPPAGSDHGGRRIPHMITHEGTRLLAEVGD